MVSLDVEAAKLSPQMRAFLVDGAAVTDGVVRSKPVRLVFEGSEFVYFFPRNAADISTETKKVSPKDIYRLRRDLVLSVVPVGPPH